MILIIILIFAAYLVCTQFESKPVIGEEEVEYGMASAETAFWKISFQNKTPKSKIKIKKKL